MARTRRPRTHAIVTEPALALGGVALIAMMGVTVVDIVARNLAGLTIRGVIEIVEMAMVWCTFAGIGAAFGAGGHITVDVANVVLPDRTARTLAQVARLSTALGMIALAWLAWIELADALEWGDTTVVLGLAHPLFWIAIFGGYALGAVASLVGLVDPDRTG